MTATVRGIKLDGREHGLGTDNSRTYTLTYHVTTTDKNDGPQTVRTAAGIPAIGDTYAAGNDFDPDAIAITKTVRPLESPQEWEVQISYSTNSADFTGVPGQDPSDPPPNPLAEPPVVIINTVTRKVPVHDYYNDSTNPPTEKALDKPLVKTNGERVDPQPEIDVSDAVISVTRNVATLDFAAFMGLANMVNLSPYQGFGERELRIQGLSAEKKFDKSIGFYWTVKYELAHRYDTWDLQFANYSTYYDDGTGTFIRAQANGIPYEVPLNVDGELATEATVHYDRYRIYRELEFNGLGLL